MKKYIALILIISFTTNDTIIERKINMETIPHLLNPISKSKDAIHVDYLIQMAASVESYNK